MILARYVAWVDNKNEAYDKAKTDVQWFNDIKPIQSGVSLDIKEIPTGYSVSMGAIFSITYSTVNTYSKMDFNDAKEVNGLKEVIRDLGFNIQ